MSVRSDRLRGFAILVVPVSLVSLVGLGAHAGEADPWADAVVAHVAGSNPSPGYTDPSTVLGEPARMSGAGIDPSVVSPFASAWMPTELLSIGSGGEVVVRFDEPVVDDSANPFGIDLIVFGNAFYVDQIPGAGVVGGLFSEGGTIEVSPDGITWTLVPGAEADGGFPTMGWIDAGPYDELPGREPTDFTRPVDPSIEPSGLAGTTYPQLLELYDGSGGGTSIDLAPLGLESIRFVRIRSTGGAGIEIDAFADVSPTGTPGPDPADVDGDGTVGFSDLVTVLAAWGHCPAPPEPCPADVDADGTVDFDDLVAVLAAWTEGP